MHETYSNLTSLHSLAEPANGHYQASHILCFTCRSEFRLYRAAHLRSVAALAAAVIGRRRCELALKDRILGHSADDLLTDARSEVHVEVAI